VARRATYFFDVHRSSAPTIKVSGGYEYLRPESTSLPLSDLKGLVNAYDYIAYDVGLLSKEEAVFLKESNIVPDSSRKTAEDEPFTLITIETGEKIGFLRFPSLDEIDQMPTDATLNSLSDQIRRHKQNVKLLIGISDWGWKVEREFLARNPEHIPDILLGSGNGSGVTGRILADGRCVWYRTYNKGKTVIEVKLLAWPDRTKPFTWSEPEKIISQSIGLSDKYYDNPEVADFFN